MAYLALFEDSNVRFLGSNNNFIHPGGTTGLDRQVSHIISAQKRDIWGLETPEDRPGEADWALSFYGLSRSGCTWVRTNMVDSSRIRMCQLERTGSGSALHSQLDGIGSPSDRL